MCRRLTYLCRTDDEDDDDDDHDDDDHYYDGEDNEDAVFDDDNDDNVVLKKVFFSDGHGVFISRVSFDTKNQLTSGLDFLRVLGAVNADGLDILTSQRDV